MATNKIAEKAVAKPVHGKQMSRNKFVKDVDLTDAAISLKSGDIFYSQAHNHLFKVTDLNGFDAKNSTVKDFLEETNRYTTINDPKKNEPDPKIDLFLGMFDDYTRLMEDTKDTLQNGSYAFVKALPDDKYYSFFVYGYDSGWTEVTDHDDHDSKHFVGIFGTEGELASSGIEADQGYLALVKETLYINDGTQWVKVSGADVDVPEIPEQSEFLGYFDSYEDLMDSSTPDNRFIKKDTAFVKHENDDKHNLYIYDGSSFEPVFDVTASDKTHFVGSFDDIGTLEGSTIEREAGFLALVKDELYIFNGNEWVSVAKKAEELVLEEQPTHRGTFASYIDLMDSGVIGKEFIKGDTAFITENGKDNLYLFDGSSFKVVFNQEDANHRHFVGAYQSLSAINETALNLEDGSIAMIANKFYIYTGGVWQKIANVQVPQLEELPTHLGAFKTYEDLMDSEAEDRNFIKGDTAFVGTTLHIFNGGSFEPVYKAEGTDAKHFIGVYANESLLENTPSELEEGYLAMVGKRLYIYAGNTWVKVVDIDLPEMDELPTHLGTFPTYVDLMDSEPNERQFIKGDTAFITEDGKDNLYLYDGGSFKAVFNDPVLDMKHFIGTFPSEGALDNSPAEVENGFMAKVGKDIYIYTDNKWEKIVNVEMPTLEELPVHLGDFDTIEDLLEVGEEIGKEFVKRSTAFVKDLGSDTYTLHYFDGTTFRPVYAKDSRDHEHFVGSFNTEAELTNAPIEAKNGYLASVGKILYVMLNDEWTKVVDVPEYLFEEQPKYLGKFDTYEDLMDTVDAESERQFIASDTAFIKDTLHIFNGGSFEPVYKAKNSDARHYVGDFKSEDELKSFAGEVEEGYLALVESDLYIFANGAWINTGTEEEELILNELPEHLGTFDNMEDLMASMKEDRNFLTRDTAFIVDNGKDNLYMFDGADFKPVFNMEETDTKHFVGSFKTVGELESSTIELNDGYLALIGNELYIYNADKWNKVTKDIEEYVFEELPKHLGKFDSYEDLIGSITPESERQFVSSDTAFIGDTLYIFNSGSFEPVYKPETNTTRHFVGIFKTEAELNALSVEIDEGYLALVMDVLYIYAGGNWMPVGGKSSELPDIPVLPDLYLGEFKDIDELEANTIDDRRIGSYAIIADTKDPNVKNLYMFVGDHFEKLGVPMQSDNTSVNYLGEFPDVKTLNEAPIEIKEGDFAAVDTNGERLYYINHGTQWGLMSKRMFLGEFDDINALEAAIPDHLVFDGLMGFIKDPDPKTTDRYELLIRSNNQWRFAYEPLENEEHAPFLGQFDTWEDFEDADVSADVRDGDYVIVFDEDDQEWKSHIFSGSVWVQTSGSDRSAYSGIFSDIKAFKASDVYTKDEQEPGDYCLVKMGTKLDEPCLWMFEDGKWNQLTYAKEQDLSIDPDHEGYVPVDGDTGGGFVMADYGKLERSATHPNADIFDGQPHWLKFKEINHPIATTVDWIWEQSYGDSKHVYFDDTKTMGVSAGVLKQWIEEGFFIKHRWNGPKDKTGFFEIMEVRKPKKTKAEYDLFINPKDTNDKVAINLLAHAASLEDHKKQHVVKFDIKKGTSWSDMVPGQTEVFAEGKKADGTVVTTAVLHKDGQTKVTPDELKAWQQNDDLVSVIWDPTIAPDGAWLLEKYVEDHDSSYFKGTFRSLKDVEGAVPNPADGMYAMLKNGTADSTLVFYHEDIKTWKEISGSGGAGIQKWTEHASYKKDDSIYYGDNLIRLNKDINDAGATPDKADYSPVVIGLEAVEANPKDTDFIQKKWFLDNIPASKGEKFQHWTFENPGGSYRSDSEAITLINSSNTFNFKSGHSYYVQATFMASAIHGSPRKYILTYAQGAVENGMTSLRINQRRIAQGTTHVAATDVPNPMGGSKNEHRQNESMTLSGVFTPNMNINNAKMFIDGQNITAGAANNGWWFTAEGTVTIFAIDITDGLGGVDAADLKAKLEQIPNWNMLTDDLKKKLEKPDASIDTVDYDVADWDNPMHDEMKEAYKLLPDIDWTKPRTFYVRATNKQFLDAVNYEPDGATDEASAGRFYSVKKLVADNGVVSSVTNPTTGDITKTFPNGNVLVTKPDGTKILTKPDGTVQTTKPDGTMVIDKPNGDKITIDPNGKTTTVKPNGTKIVKQPDGSTVQTNPDGTKVMIDSLGVKTTVDKNGVKTTILKDGTKVVTQTDGSTASTDTKGTVTLKDPSGNIISVTEKDGTTVVTATDGTVTKTHPDGSTTVIDPNTKIETKTKPDGTVVVTNPDGTMTTTMPDGTIIKVDPDKTKTVTHPDGTKTITDPQGNVTNVDAQGNTIVTMPNGDKVATKADGSKITTKPDGTIIETDPQGNVTKTTNPDGSYEVKKADGGMTYHKPDGTKTKETWPDGGIIETLPNGDVKTTKADGTSVVKHPDGTETKYDANGKEIVAPPEPPMSPDSKKIADQTRIDPFRDPFVLGGNDPTYRINVNGVWKTIPTDFGSMTKVDATNWQFKNDAGTVLATIEATENGNQIITRFPTLPGFEIHKNRAYDSTSIRGGAYFGSVEEENGNIVRATDASFQPIPFDQIPFPVFPVS